MIASFFMFLSLVTLFTVSGAAARHWIDRSMLNPVVAPESAASPI